MSLYLHVPWCRAVCPYCGFSVTQEPQAAPWSAWVDRILAEHRDRAADLTEPSRTVFIGGGTPSRMPARALARLLEGLGGPFDEVSIEINPEDAHQDWLDAALRAGVTRVSIGVQTLQTPQAKLLGRAHTTAIATRAINRVRETGFRSWSVDLIFAVPGQTVQALTRDLEALLAFEPPHVSLYGLTFEPGTPFEARRKAGKLSPLPDDQWREMYDLLVARLEQAGLGRYEVSNFARPDHRCQHNIGYWTGRPYLGLGPSAHGLAADGRRWINRASVDDWLTSEDPTAHTERPTPKQASMDRLISGLRWVEGVALSDLDPRPQRAAISSLVDLGLLEITDAHIRLTHAGFPVADQVVRRLIDGLQ